MSVAGARINALLDELLGASTFADVFDGEMRLEGTVLIFAPPGGPYATDLEALRAGWDELVDLLYDQPRDPGEVNLWRLFALGLAMGACYRLVPDFLPRRVPGGAPRTHDPEDRVEHDAEDVTKQPAEPKLHDDPPVETHGTHSE